MFIWSAVGELGGRGTLWLPYLHGRGRSSENLLLDQNLQKHNRKSILGHITQDLTFHKEFEKFLFSFFLLLIVRDF